MKCPQCQRENTLRLAENNRVVCNACGSRFRIKSRSNPAAPPQPDFSAPAPPSADANRAPVFPNVPPQAPPASSGRFSWNGRLSRSEFLVEVGVCLFWGLAASLVFGALIWHCLPYLLDPYAERESKIAVGAGLIFLGLVYLAVLLVVVCLPLFTASAKRLRDAGMSPYLALLHLAVSLPLTIYLAIVPSQTAPAPYPNAPTPPIPVPVPVPPQGERQAESVEPPQGELPVENGDAPQEERAAENDESDAKPAQKSKIFNDFFVALFLSLFVVFVIALIFPAVGIVFVIILLFAALSFSTVDEENDVSGAVPTQAPAQPNANQSPSVKYCVKCGTPLTTPSIKYCVKCGTPLTTPSIKYCVKCGTPLTTPIQDDDAQVNDKLTFVALDLAAFVILFLILLFTSLLLF